jgi:hypothetical protein
VPGGEVLNWVCFFSWFQEILWVGNNLVKAGIFWEILRFFAHFLGKMGKSSRKEGGFGADVSKKVYWCSNTVVRLGGGGKK